MADILAIIKTAVSGVKGVLSAVLAFMMSVGAITSPSTENPIEFKDSENVKLSFVAVSDTHIRDDSFMPRQFGSLFEDMGNSKEKFDALAIYGDLTDLGFNSEYKAMFSYLDKQTVADKVLLTMGNHDVRFEYKKNKKLIMDKVEEYLDIDTNGKSYYSYDINGYTFIMLCTEKQIFEKAYLSPEQLAWLDSELARATKDGKPVFIGCHQPLANTHGLPEAWKTGDLGEQSEQVREILIKYKNVFLLSGHLHLGLRGKAVEEFADGVYSINLPSYGKGNHEGLPEKQGGGFIFEVYDNEVIFSCRDFVKGENSGEVYSFEIK